MVATPANKCKKIVKRAKKFTRFEFEDYPHKLKASWRKPHGIDNRMRRQYKGNKPLVKIGYGNKKELRHVMANGFKKFLIRCPKDIEMLLMNNREYAGEIASNVSAATRVKILTRAAELNVRLTNGKAKIATGENKQAN